MPDAGPSKSRTYIVSSHVKLVLREQPIVVKTFFVRFLLPVWFQFESYESRSDGG